MKTIIFFCFMVLMSFSGKTQVWTQIGSDISGEAVDDQSGYSLSINSIGTIVAIGGHHNYGFNGIASGHVRVFENIGGVWTQIGSDIDGEFAYDYFGYSVDISSNGSIVAIGGLRNDGSGSNAGHVRVFENIGGVWTQIGSDIDGETAGDRSGYSVSISSNGSIVAIGAPQNSSNGLNAGHVRVFENIGGVWTQIGSDIDGETAGDRSGSSVSISSSGTIVAIGAPQNSSNAGHVRVFENIGGVWTQIGSSIDGEAAGDQSGCSVDINSDGSIIAIGARYNNSNAGHVRVFENIGGVWTQIGSDIDGETAGDQLGQSISLNNDGSIVAIGSHLGDNGGSNSGYVEIHSTNTSSLISVTKCISYTVPSGNQTYFLSGTYTDTIPNSFGSDSIITINLTINTVDNTTSINGTIITANAILASYQWLDCDNNYSVILDETNQSFAATVNGSYAVIVTENGCTDTSACESITSVGIIENTLTDAYNIIIYPNPNNGTFEVSHVPTGSDISILNPAGRKVFEFKYLSGDKIQISNLPQGMYYLVVVNDDVAKTLKLLVH